MAVLQIPITKAAGVIEFDTDELLDDKFPADMYLEIVKLGMKAILNRGMSKIVGEKTDGSKKAAMEIAEGNLGKLREGKIKRSAGSAKAKGGNRELTTEAMRLAKALVKDAIKRNGEKVSTRTAAQITAAAKLVLEGEHGPGIWEMAEANLKDRAVKEASLAAGLDQIALAIPEDPELVKKADAKKAEGKKTTKDKKAAGQVAQRAKPQGGAQHATH